MEKTNFISATRTLGLLTKPGIVMGNAITTAGGFALASKGGFDFLLFLIVMVGLSLIIASACVFNNVIDRVADAKMERTKNRPLVTGLIAVQTALVFAVALLFAGTAFLAVFTNLLAVFTALFGFFVYVLLYSFTKYQTIYGTLIGSIAGAVPPVIGYCAVSNQLDAGAWILFAMMTVWQMPHFFAIAIYRMDDYAAASIPVLPLIKGLRATKIQMLLYIAAFIGCSCLLVLFSYVGFAYLIIASALGLGWLSLCFKGFSCENDSVWARKMFVFSLIVVMGICITIPFSTL
jgi:protoheme IX farnesyltransferase